ncbi:hypothetical protein [Streptomyces sp. SAJ15]|uniref:hypothetical protein n=1 Tax=Streptomyces sp. SAJ15 TaxID=2011095 RepID=UPI0011867370|nr:hypothetical protein [Streptomyces sp. SAJ15]TVL89770.1 hypothetical protein CD790_25575 [Streptomyces sp. SAJ15]
MPKPKYILTATSRTGKPVNLITGKPTDSINVYDDADLQRRLAAAENDPRDLHVTVEEIRR